MLKLLAFLWCGCWHKWTILGCKDLYGEGWQGQNVRIGEVYTLQCVRCGDVVRRRLA